MLDVCQNPVSRVSDDELRPFVRSALIGLPKDPSGLRQVIRSPYDYHSSFGIELLIAEFDDGTELSLIFKDLSPHALLDEARRVRPSELYQPEREIFVYRDILADAGLGTATCYGSVIDHDGRRYWLLLEKVAGDELYTIGEFSIWRDVARWLALAHSQFADSSKDNQAGALLRYDTRFFRASIERANSQIATRAAPVGAHAANLRNLWTMCHKSVDQICKLPPTLIHGDFYASNILISVQATNDRICPVDWELAGIGLGLLDLAALVSGKWTEPERQDLSRAYFDALPGSRMRNDFEQFAKTLLACRLLVAVAWLGWSPDWQPPALHRHDWLQEALSISEQLQELG